MSQPTSTKKIARRYWVLSDLLLTSDANRLLFECYLMFLFILDDKNFSLERHLIFSHNNLLLFRSDSWERNDESLCFGPILITITSFVCPSFLYLPASCQSPDQRNSTNKSASLLICTSPLKLSPPRPGSSHAATSGW